ncbi:MAG: glutathione S-transferase family protein [Bradyrhizobium icense]|nr:MAG: glutathione S-transferase family protein [Bradyrhizobium icense]
MKLYDLKAGTNPRRVRIFLSEKGVDIPKVEVDMLKGENRSEDFLAKNPMGTMPVLELDDGTFLSESVAICRYIEELHPDPPLMGTNARERALVEMWNRRAELELLRPITDAFVHLSPFWAGRREQIPATGEASRQAALSRMAWLDAELAGRPYLAGDAYTIADITAQCACVLGKNTGTPIPPDLSSLTRWFAGVSARPTARA